MRRRSVALFFLSNTTDVIMGSHINGLSDTNGARIYTRTVVLWAVGIDIDTDTGSPSPQRMGTHRPSDALWENVAVVQPRELALSPTVSLRQLSSHSERRRANYRTPAVLMMTGETMTVFFVAPTDEHRVWSQGDTHKAHAFSPDLP